MKNQKTIFTVLGCIAVLLSVASALDLELLGAGLSMAGAYLPVGVGKPTGNPGVPGDKDPYIVVFKVQDAVRESLQRDGKSVLIPQNIQMKPGKHMIQLYTTVNTLQPSHTGEGEPDAMGFTHGLAFDHPGQELEILEFQQNWIGEDVIVMVGNCSGTKKKVYGTPCAPLQITPSGVNDDTKNAARFSLASKNRSKFVPGIYEGTLTLEEVMATVAADEETVDVSTGSGQYQLTTGTAAPISISGLDNPVHNGIYSLLGSGGAFPSVVEAGATFILKDGTDWNAVAGSQLTLKAYKNAPAAFVFIEHSRS